MPNQTLEISTSSIIRVFVVLLAIGFIFAIWQIIASIFMAIVISAAAEPGVRALAKLKIPRLLAATIIYAVGFLVIASVFYTILPTLIVETKNLSADLPARYAEVVSEIERFFGQAPGEGEAQQQIQGFLSGIQSGVSSGSAGLFSFTFNLFGGIISSILIFVISFYLVIQKDGLEHFLKSIIPPAHQDYAIDLWKRVQNKLGRWFQGQLVLGVFVGAFMFLALWLMGVKYALTIAFMVGVLEVIPVIGPILGGLLAFLLISFQSPMLALAAIAAYIIIEQLQQHLFLPHVMSKAVGLNPILIIVALLVAAKLIGFWGVILALPLTVTIYEFVKDFRK
jgi:predicted PurR-regulated permease PerM